MSVLKWLYKQWISFGELISKIMNPLLLFVVYFAMIVPLALLFKILGRDELSLKWNRKVDTHWKNREDQPPSQMEKQF
ncbi:MAG: hypothetical protein K2Q26_10020 [Bdellovibrionales bacterium]|nr:hypothetical protein [Bdellovibrionales bacterium]